MKVIFRLVILSVILMVVIHYVTPQKNNPLNTWLVSAEQMVNKIINKNKNSEPVTVSRWTDAKGVVHYENRLVNGARKIEVDPVINVLPPIPVVKLPKATNEKPKAINDELRDIQEAKKAHFEALIDN